MALLLSEPFTGSNGAGWSATNWTDQFNGNDGSATSSIQSNRGRVTVPVSANRILRWADDVVLGSDYDIRFSAIMDSAVSQEIRCYIASEFQTAGNGHYVWVNPSTDVVGIGRTDAFADVAPVTSTSYVFASTDTVFVHIKVRGTACWVRVWKNAEHEPLSWNLTGTLTYTNTETHLGVVNLGASTISVDFDDFLAESNKMVTKTVDTGWPQSGDLLKLSHSSPTWTGPVKVIVWKHGGLGGNAEEVDGWDLWPEIISDANGRYVLYAADDGFGGNGAFGNDTELTSINAVRVRALNDHPNFPRVALACHSAGGMGIVNYTSRWPNDVAGMVAVDPILDAAQVDIDDGGTFVSTMLNPAYGGAGSWAPVASQRDPNLLAQSSSALRSKFIQIYDATGDAVLSTTQMTNYVSSHGARATRTAVSSGDHGTVHNFISETDVISFLETLPFALDEQFDPRSVEAFTPGRRTPGAWRQGHRPLERGRSGGNPPILATVNQAANSALKVGNRWATPPGRFGVSPGAPQFRWQFERDADLAAGGPVDWPTTAFAEMVGAVETTFARDAPSSALAAPAGHGWAVGTRDVASTALAALAGHAWAVGTRDVPSTALAAPTGDSTALAVRGLVVSAFADPAGIGWAVGTRNVPTTALAAPAAVGWAVGVRNVPTTALAAPVLHAWALTESIIDWPTTALAALTAAGWAVGTRDVPTTGLAAPAGHSWAVGTRNVPTTALAAPVGQAWALTEAIIDWATTALAAAGLSAHAVGARGLVTTGLAAPAGHGWAVGARNVPTSALAAPATAGWAVGVRNVPLVAVAAPAGAGWAVGVRAVVTTALGSLVLFGFTSPDAQPDLEPFVIVVRESGLLVVREASRTVLYEAGPFTIEP